MKMIKLTKKQIEKIKPLIKEGNRLNIKYTKLQFEMEQQKEKISGVTKDMFPNAVKLLPDGNGFVVLIKDD